MNLPGITLDKEGYPTEEFLEWIRTFDTIKGDPLEFIQIILDNWWPDGDYGWKIYRLYKGRRKVTINTCGWSGNEDMMSALKSNFVFWAFCYFSHRTGGHYTFYIKKP